MRLSVCLIVRNEESRLAGAIESVRAVADEIVVTDTGSTDTTVAMAERLGARVSHFAWCEDFAAARNACRAHARGDWLLWLDADERLKPGSETELRSAISNTAAAAWHVIREDFFAHDRTDWYSEMYQLRLVRRDLPCSFVGRIHEHLEPSPVDIAGRLGKFVRASSIRLQHWGYTADRQPAKLRRAAAMCAMELRDRPGQLYYLVEHARALIAIRDPGGPAALAAATVSMLEHRASPTPPSPMAASLIEQLLALPGQKWISIDDLLDLASRWFPRSAPLIWAAARTHSIRGEWPLAESALRRLLRLLETSTYDRYMSFDPRITEDARFNLGVALVRQARLPEARAIFEKLLGGDRRATDARKNLDAINELLARHGG